MKSLMSEPCERNFTSQNRQFVKWKKSFWRFSRMVWKFVSSGSADSGGGGDRMGAGWMQHTTWGESGMNKLVHDYWVGSEIKMGRKYNRGVSIPKKNDENWEIVRQWQHLQRLDNVLSLLVNHLASLLQSRRIINVWEVLGRGWTARAGAIGRGFAAIATTYTPGGDEEFCCRRSGCLWTLKCKRFSPPLCFSAFVLLTLGKLIHTNNSHRGWIIALRSTHCIHGNTPVGTSGTGMFKRIVFKKLFHNYKNEKEKLKI